MGEKKLTRRTFLRRLAPKPSSPPYTEADPLFERYRRKKAGPRTYSNEVKPLAVGKEDVESLARVGNVTSGLQPYTGPWTEAEVLHLLRRTNFGWKKAWVDSLRAMTPSAAVDAVLNVPAGAPPPPVNWYNNFYADENGLALGADWTDSFFSTGAVGQTSNRYRVDSLRRWLFGLMLNGDVTIREKMVWFWYHFMPIDFDTITQSSNQYVNTNSARIFYRYFKLFRDNVLGNFRTLIRAVAVEPSMMFYLNNQANTATAPDENFARELMELFTIGKDDPNNSYTQADVVEAAKVLTGWRVQNLNTANPATNFVASLHRTGNKQFSAFYNNTVITGTGAGELDQLLDMIFTRRTDVSRYICRRLYRFFVYYDIDANVEANVIVPLAQTFVASNWNIKPVLEQLFKSQHFFDVANRGAYIKSPFDLVAGLLNSFGVNTTDSNIEYQYRIWSRYNDVYALGMEQQAGAIPNVSGWNAFYQTPAYHQYWINSNTVQRRFAFVRDLINSHTVGSVLAGGALRRFGIDTVAFAQQFGNSIAGEPNALVDSFVKYLLPVDLSTSQKEAMKGRTLLYQQTADSYWTTAWGAYTNNPSTPNRNTVESRLKSLVTEICQLAEYQLM